MRVELAVARCVYSPSCWFLIDASTSSTRWNIGIDRPGSVCSRLLWSCSKHPGLLDTTASAPAPRWCIIPTTRSSAASTTTPTS